MISRLTVPRGNWAGAPLRRLLIRFSSPGVGDAGDCDAGDCDAGDCDAGDCDAGFLGPGSSNSPNGCVRTGGLARSDGNCVGTACDGVLSDGIAAALAGVGAAAGSFFGLEAVGTWAKLRLLSSNVTIKESFMATPSG
ncbi:MAG: hypothetical protein U9N87_01685 [Planctomycetota bacterium]|nr:hypothetical protein [Planctomycetota bacterium]